MCNALTNPMNGDIMFSNGTFVGSVATYSCTMGFESVGSETRTCQSGSGWSGMDPSCEREYTSHHITVTFCPQVITFLAKNFNLQIALFGNLVAKEAVIFRLCVKLSCTCFISLIDCCCSRILCLCTKLPLR